ncbi:MAG: hypothetical protein SFX73_26385 [Kofleriaceae bacterium]|nr:hypothetical protein [Kofleriaceae bacterium]
MNLITLTLATSVGLGGCGTDDVSVTAELHPLDTAILFPLPERMESDHLLRTDDAGAHGALLPDHAVAQLPALGSTRNAELVPRLRLVAANVDPCFPSGKEGAVDAQGASLCRPQLRYIFQPLVEQNGTVTTEDVTVHTFYEMDRATFVELVADLRAARTEELADDEPIDVHPILRAQGPEGPYAKALETVMLDYAGAANLVKVTFIGLRGGGIGWQMGGVDFDGMTPTDMVVPETSVTRQELVNNATSGELDAAVDPETRFSTSMVPLLDSAAARASTDAELRQAFRNALEIDNPATDLNPDTVDCASCHLATPARSWAERNLGFVAAEYEEAYSHPRWNLESRSQTKANTQSMRCFGYFGRDVAISHRTINEAAAVADAINHAYLGGTP